jgi:hypothetical protein
MRAEHEIAGEASNHPSGQLNHLGALDADTTDAGPERTLWYRRRAVNADDQSDAAGGFLDTRRSRSEQGRRKRPLTAQSVCQPNGLTIPIEKEPKCPSKTRSTFERPTR